MKLFDFSLLSQTEQLDVLYKEGIYLAQVKNSHSHRILFQYNGFYVEIVYKKYRSLVKTIRCFESTEHIDVYLQKIDIEELMNC